MRTINLHALTASDITPIFDALNNYLQQQGLALITDNVFLKPEMLAKRWELSNSCLNNSRFSGGGPTYIKTGPGPMAQVRYPMLGENGVLMFEQRRMYRSTAEESASIETTTSQLIPSALDADKTVDRSGEQSGSVSANSRRKSWQTYSPNASPTPRKHRANSIISGIRK